MNPARSIAKKSAKEFFSPLKKVGEFFSALRAIGESIVDFIRAEEELDDEETPDDWYK